MPLFRRKPEPAPAMTESTAAEVVGLLRPFVATATSLPRGTADGAPEILPGLVLVIAVHRGDQLDFLPPESFGAFGGPEPTRALAVANVRALPAPTVEAAPAKAGRPDSVVWSALYADPFGAGRVADLGALLGSFVAGGMGTDEVNRSRGLLIAVPHWRHVLLHLMQGPGVLPVLDLMGGAASAAYDAAPAQERVSPNVFFVAGADGPRQVVARPDGPGKVRVDTRGPIGTVLFGPRGLLERG